MQQRKSTNNSAMIMNVLNFQHRTPETFGFYTEKKAGMSPIERNEFPDELIANLKSEDKQLQRLYTYFSGESQADYTATIHFSEAPGLARHYYLYLLYTYFKEQADLIKENFVNDLTVYILEKDNSLKGYWDAYRRFTLRVQIGRLSSQPELVIMERGVRRVLQKSYYELQHLDAHHFTSFLFQGQFYHQKKLPQEAFYDTTKTFPVLTPPLEDYLEQTYDRPSPLRNSFPEKLNLISDFKKTFLDTDELQAFLPGMSKDFYKVRPRAVFHTHYDSDKIILGPEKNRAESITPKYDLRKKGPYQLPVNPHNIKFVFIYHKEDAEYAKALFRKLGGEKKEPESGKPAKEFDITLYGHSRIKFRLEQENNIIFKNRENPFDEISDYLDNQYQPQEGLQYFAIYISPYHKEHTDPNQTYYRVKEKLLKHFIVSQAFYKYKISDQDFERYYMNNIASAILAKLGGVPWTIKPRNENNDLVAGIGAFKPAADGVRYIGSSFAFSPKGEFRQFDATTENKAHLLAPKIKLMVQDFLKHHDSLDRLIIHLYPEIRKKDIQPFYKVLRQLGREDLPVFIVTINKTASLDYMCFEKDDTIKMPHSGTIVQVSKRSYLLHNNTRYRDSNAKIESYPMPLKIKLQCTQSELLDDLPTVKGLIDQVYQFSRIYWKSVKQQSHPVTVKYPELVARVFPYFKNQSLDDFAKTSMWFL